MNKEPIFWAMVLASISVVCSLILLGINIGKALT